MPIVDGVAHCSVPTPMSPNGEDDVMRLRKLGSSDLEVSEISLGSWLTYAGGVEAEQSRACTDAAFDAGINFFDTANVYGQGAAESAWGEILAGRPRDSYVLATKVWGRMSDTDRGLSAEQIAKQIDASLRRLRTDYVDLYQAHRFDTDAPIEDTIEALQKVVETGKARYLGFSEWTPEQIRAGIEIGGPDLFVSSQPQYSMLWQAPEAEVFPLCGCQRHFPHRVVSVGAGRSDRQVQAGSTAARGLQVRQRHDELRDGHRLQRCGVGGRAAPHSHRRRGRNQRCWSRAGLGAASSRGRLGHHRRVASRTGPCERRRVGYPAHRRHPGRRRHRTG
jgi:aryl-alcohol dehydrogenase-like predicted oxidoreductase